MPYPLFLISAIPDFVTFMHPISELQNPSQTNSRQIETDSWAVALAEAAMVFILNFVSAQSIPSLQSLPFF